jgi:hypothetical protein
LQNRALSNRQQSISTAKLSISFVKTQACFLIMSRLMFKLDYREVCLEWRCAAVQRPRQQFSGMVVMKTLQASLSLSRSLSLSTKCRISLQPPTAYVNQPKLLVYSEIYHILIATNILVDGMDRRPSGLIGNCTGGGRLTIRGTCRRNRYIIPLTLM